MRFEHLFLPPSQTDSAVVGTFCDPVRRWWQSRFTELSLPQRLAIPAIASGKNTLICAPTGTGKTLCAFISILSDLISKQAAGTLDPTIDTVYISPLRALGADIERNLLAPLTQIFPATTPATAAPIRIAQRTGDTSPKDRARLLRTPPHILITTPESLALCLANPGMRAHLTKVRRIIVDELHALAPNKRGTDLALSIERLADLVTSRGGGGGGDPQRIGLSATIAPLERMAEFLVGSPPSPLSPQSSVLSTPPRTCAIADASFHRPLELSIASMFGSGPTVQPFSSTATINRNVYEFLEKTIRAHRTTLVFANTRAATERVTFALRKRLKAALATGQHDDIIAPEMIAAHHSSLDRELRLDIEHRLKKGELRAVVCSTSLELGIDIGTIDHVVLLNSPKGVARGLQRVGRSGHSLNSTAAGTFLPTVPADLIESLVTADAMRKRQVDEISYPQNCLDVLAQHLIGMALQARPDGLHTEHAYALVRRTAPFATLARDQFDQTLAYLATQDLRDTARVDAKLWLEPDGEGIEEGTEAIRHKGTEGRRDENHPPLVPQCLSASVPSLPSGLLHPVRPSIAGLYSQNVGTITQDGQVKVRIKHADKKSSVIGTVEEAFAQILKPGDRFVLSGRCVQVTPFDGPKNMAVDVTECAGQTPTVPRWFSGLLSMEQGLAARMRDFRAKVRAIAPAGTSAIARMLMRQYQVDEPTAKAAAAYLHAQFRYADIPTEGQLIVERVPDELGGPGTAAEGASGAAEATVLVFHTMIGRAANDALARTVAYRLARRFHRPAPLSENPLAATVVVDDHAFGIWIAASTEARRADRTLVRSLLSPAQFEEDLAAAVETSDLFRAQFRYCAIRAHALLQNKFGRRRYIGQMQSYANRLYEALKESHPGHLLLSETRRTVMNDLLNAPAAKAYLESLPQQSLRLLDLPTPSPFAFGLFAAGGTRRDTLQLADTADFLLAMYEQVQRRLQSTPADAPAELFS